MKIANKNICVARLLQALGESSAGIDKKSAKALEISKPMGESMEALTEISERNIWLHLVAGSGRGAGGEHV